MKYLKIILISCLVLFGTTDHLYSQSRFDVHLGPAFPLSKFGLYGINEYISNPTIGINTGVKYSYIFSEIGIGVFAGIDFMYNGIDKEYKEEVEKWPDFLNADPPKYHAYYNIPASTGLSYDFILYENLMLVCYAGLTFNYLLISDSDLGLYKSSTEPAYSLGGRRGAGLIIKERVSINLDYLGLGNHTVSVESIMGLSQTKEEFSTDLSIHMLTLTAGIVF